MTSKSYGKKLEHLVLCRNYLRRAKSNVKSRHVVNNKGERNFVIFVGWRIVLEWTELTHTRHLQSRISLRSTGSDRFLSFFKSLALLALGSKLLDDNREFRKRFDYGVQLKMQEKDVLEYREKVLPFPCILPFDNHHTVKSFTGVFNLKWEFCGNYISVLPNNISWLGIL